MSPVSGAPAPRAPSLLDSPAFRRLWAAGALAGLMRWLEVLVVGVFVFRLTGSALDVTLTLVLRSIPSLLLGAIAGALIERVDRRRMLAIGLAALAVVSAVLAALVAAGAVRLWHVGLGVLLSGTFWATDQPLRRTMLGETVDAARVGAAMGLDSSTQNAMRMLGPLAGGLLFDLVGMAGAYAVGALAYGGSALLVLSLPRPVRVERLAATTLLADLREVFAFVRADRAIFGTLAVTVVMNVFVFPYNALMAVMGGTVLGLDATRIGLLGSAEGLGALLGCLAIAWRARPRHFATLYFFGCVIYVAALALFAGSTTFPLSFAALLTAGLGMAGFGTMQSTILFTLAPPAMRPRIMGVLSCAIGLYPAGMVEIGLLADRFGAPAAIGIMAAEGALALALAWILWPEIRRSPQPTGPAS